MRRREFITLIGGAAATWPLAARAQAPFKIGLLDTGVGPSFTDAFMRKLGELGYADGRNVVFVRKAAEGDTGRLKDLAADLVAQRVDVIVTMGTPAGFAAKQATGTIPIVLGANSDPVGVGLVASLARPGGNVTGTSLMAPELSAKRLDILRTLSPKISRFAILWDSSNPGMAARVHETQIAADQSHVLLHVVGPRNPEELEAALAELLAQHPDALLVTTEAFTRRHLARILEFANGNKIPAMFEDGAWVEAGGTHVLRAQLPGGLRVRGRAGRQDIERRQARRSTDHAADDVRAGTQSQDREGTWDRHPAEPTGAGQPGDRMRRRDFIALSGICAGVPQKLSTRFCAEQSRLISRSSNQTRSSLSSI